ncbi:MAG: hypothetical protein FXF47_04705 [Candidatus Mcinerneyibacterium aminivorans]|uniref:Uncharacterized protein n=1 Tax=Candidatus Mcinerneyibacterium aminivorans TaxID=2703815 RepID=A0A5D0MFX6_9BACT|nr:MAG: hypothetical protein FXF47_04705 [Candidatus Mcinerneyibacterium aminivorans]
MYLYEDISKEERERLLDNLAEKVVKYNLAVPGIIFFESTKYLNRIGSQFLVFSSPIVDTVLPSLEIEKYAAILEERSSVEYLLDKIEELENEKRKEKEMKKKNKKGLIKKIKDSLFGENGKEK